MYRREMSLRSSIILLLLMVAAQSPLDAGLDPQTTENDWPMFMHDPSHSGYTEEFVVPEPLTGRLNVKWKVGLGERVETEAQPIVAYGKVYIGVMNGKLHAIDVESGQIDWTFQAGGAIPQTAAAANGKVYFGCEDGKVYALDATTGSLVWSYQTDGPVFSSPTAVGSVLYIGSFDTYLYALDAGTGALNWRYKTGGPVWTSPAVVGDRIYFGSEDMYAYCVNATSHSLVWKELLNGVSMRNTYPVVSQGVVIFTTVKPGVESYMPLEDFELVQGLTATQVIDLWNDYYQQFPERRSLFYLDVNTGENRWDPVNKKYVPFPLPYWGLIVPLVDSSGFAWFPASGGGGDHALDHNDRLWKVDLTDGTIYQAGSQDEYMMQPDETGTHTMGGTWYYQTAQMNIGAFDTTTQQKYHIYGGPWWPYGEPLDPTPTIHENRYGAGMTMWEVGASSPLVIANGVGYYTAYSWLYALTSDNIAGAGEVDLGVAHTTGPSYVEKTYGDFVNELNWRVAQIVASGPLKPQPIFWGWNRANLHPIWLESEVIVSLAQTIPYIQANLREDLEAYLETEVTTHILNIGYDYRTRCMIYGSEGVIDPCQSSDRENEISIQWHSDDLNVIAGNLYAMWAYAHYTEDWQIVIDNWALLSGLYGRLADAFDDDLGFYMERNPDGSAKRWHTPDFKSGLQIAAMQSVCRMAERVGDATAESEACDLLQQMYAGRRELSERVQQLYDEGTFQRAEVDEIEEYEILPWQGYRDRDTDSRQVFWTDGTRWEIFSYPSSSGGDDGIISEGQGDYSNLISYHPMFPELGTFLADQLYEETEQYIHNVINLNPWWYWNDASHCMQTSGENLYNQPHLSSAIFQAKAYILGEDFDILKNQLPWEYTAAGFNDVYRLQNLVALLQSEGAYPEPEKTAIPVTAEFGQTITYTIALIGSGQLMTLTDSIPVGTSYVLDSARTIPMLGNLVADSAGLTWTGTVTEMTLFQITFQVQVETSEPMVIENVATVQKMSGAAYPLRAVAVANGYKVYLPMILK